ncbi:MAG: hypothetical protein AAGI10_05660, partial [Pseudomonadota bacterium]
MDVATSFHGRNLRVAQVRHTALESYDVGPTDDHVVVFSLAQPEIISRLYDGKISGVNEFPRTTSILPAGRKSTWECKAETEVLHLYLDDEVLRRHAEENSKLDASGLEMQDTMGTVDEFFSRLAPILQQQIASPSETTRLMVDGFEQLLAAHLLSQYSNTNRVPARNIGLDAASLNRVMDYIRSHLEADLPLRELAAQTSLSPFQFARAFK